ncbi:MAG: histidine kinase dimerization/phospho-acceptor domain-containing protein [Hyphomicrobiales bacterium]|jgi:PAS domain S-box-containing protein
MSQTDQALSDQRALAAQLIDPHDTRPAWVWSGDGMSLIWSNEAGLASLELDGLDGQEVTPSAPAQRSLQAVARTQVGQSGRGRIEILRVNAGGHQETLVATCRPVMLGDTTAVLALGNASRPRSAPVTEPVDDDRGTEEPDIHKIEDLPTAHAAAVAAVEPSQLVTGPDDAPDFTLDISSPSFDAPVEASQFERSDETAAPSSEAPSEADATEPERRTEEPSQTFAFKPRSRPHRFSFMVDSAGRIENLSSGLLDAVGPGTALRDGEVASEALLDRLGDLPAAIFHGVDERRRFSEHEVMWPVSDHALVVPVRLSAFDEDDEKLRVFGTALTGKAVEHSAPNGDGAVSDLPTDPSAPAIVAPLDAAPLDESAANAAGLFTRDPVPNPVAEQMTTSAQVPGGATVVAAASALAAGIAGGLSRPLAERTASPVRQPVQALEDALATKDAAAAGLWRETPDHNLAASTPVAGINDTLEPAEAEAAGLWSSAPAETPPSEEPEADVFTETDAGTDGQDDFPAETVSAMKAVAAGVAAGLAGGVAGGVVSALQERADDEADDHELEDQASEDAQPTSSDETSASTSQTDLDEDDLSRPERLTFQEIARRLGARISGRDGDDDGPQALHGGQESSLDRYQPGDVIHFARDDHGTVVPDRGAGELGSPAQEISARVLPFTRTEPNAERMVLDRLPLGIIIYSDEAILYANRAALDLAGLASLQALKAMDGIETLFAEGMTDDGNGAMTLIQPDGTPVSVTGRLQSVRWDGQAAALMSLREHTPADSEAQEASQDASLLAAGATSIADGAIQGANASDGALPLVRARIGELEAIIDLASDGVVTLDGDGEIKDLNQAAQALVGYAADDLIGQPFRLLFPEDSRQTALDYLDDMASQGRLSLFNEGRELECITSQGGLVPVFMTLGRLTDDEPAVYCAVLRDLSPFKQAETDLVEARRAAEEASAHKSDFLARVSHEIRTPLNAVIGFSEVMLEERFGPVGSERYRQYLRDIHTSGEHLMSLLNDLLDLSKIEAGKMELSFGEVDLNDVVQQCLAIMQPQANQGRIIVRTSLPLSLPKVVADVRSVRQVVLNLMSNAIKFTDPGGQIIVSTLYEPSGEVSLRVRDTGRGMNAADVELALEPFRQVPTTLNQVITGTGLGLPLTKALVEANRAQFGLSSTPGEGTLAMMTFPSQRVLAE